MPCVCDSCFRHARVLGLASVPASKDALHHAYRRAAKAWHPDRFANDAARIPEAEERFKLVQAAYRELLEHAPEDSEDDGPLVEATGRARSKPAGRDSAKREPVFNQAPAHAWFRNVQGCYVASQFPPQAQAMAERHLGLYDYPTAIVDLSGDGSFSRFFLMASHGVMMRDYSGTVALLRYDDLGKIELLDREEGGTIRFWERIAESVTGVKQKLSLEILRRNGSHFCLLAGQVDDGVKIAIYQFLSHKKRENLA